MIQSSEPSPPRPKRDDEDVGSGGSMDGSVGHMSEALSAADTSAVSIPASPDQETAAAVKSAAAAHESVGDSKSGGGSARAEIGVPAEEENADDAAAIKLAAIARTTTAELGSRQEESSSESGGGAAASAGPLSASAATKLAEVGSPVYEAGMSPLADATIQAEKGASLSSPADRISQEKVAVEIGIPLQNSSTADISRQKMAVEIGMPSNSSGKTAKEASIYMRGNEKSTAEYGLAAAAADPPDSKEAFQDEPDEHGAATTATADGIERAVSAQPRAARQPGAYSLAPGRASVCVTSPAAITAAAAVVVEDTEILSAPVSVPSGMPGDDNDDGGNVIATAVDDASAVVYAKTVHKDRSKLIKVAACTVAVVGVIIGIAVGVIVGGRNGSAQAAAAAQTTPWKECIVPPQDNNGEETAPPAALSARAGMILEFIGSKGLYFASDDDDAKAVLTEPCSPQNRALTWLADDDLLLVPSSFSYRFELEQRFALATLFFSTNGAEEWSDAANWLTGVHECEWKGIACDEEVAMATGVAIAAGKVTGITLAAGNNVGGRLPRELGFVLFLTGFEIGMNPALGGPIPSEVSRLFHLETLHITGTNISGPIPRDLFSGDAMVSLTRLTLANNALSGSIPDSIGSSLLVIVSLGNNRLTGSIPSSVVNMKDIGHLMLSNNELTGSLPANLSQLNETLAFLDVSGNNQLEGPIPELAALEWLICLGLGDNNFFGDLPMIPECLGQLDIDGFDGAVSEETCSHFDQFRQDSGATICGAVGHECTCCQECEIKPRGFCAPGKEAKLPGRCSLPPSGELPPGANPQRPQLSSSEGIP